MAVVGLIFTKTAADCPMEWRRTRILTRVKLDSFYATLIIIGKYKFSIRADNQLIDVSQFLGVSSHISTLRPRAPTS